MRRRHFVSILSGLGLLALGAMTPVAAQPAPAGKWLAEDIFGGGVIDRLQTTLEFTSAGGIAGISGCNHYFGTMKIEGGKISFSQIGSTQMACATPVMNQEAKLFAALQASRTWNVDPKKKLLLRDEKGAVILRFARLQ
jgi:heat shock protein HslJ